MSRVTVKTILEKKGKERIAALTAYDYPTAAMLDEAGLDILLIGDSVGNVIYGHDTTLSVTMDMMIRHTQAVARGSKRSLIITDMPFASYQPSVSDAIRNASRCLAEGGAQAVKLEGGIPMQETIARLVELGIPVMAHVGLTPQSVHQFGGYRIQGRQPSEADRIMADAIAVSKAGAFSVVLECVEPELASTITKEIAIPTIGIGSGEECDGQILVTNDFLGHTVSHVPKFVRPKANLRTIITEAAQGFVRDVKNRST